MQAVYDFRESSGGIGFSLGTSIVTDGPGADDDVFVLERTGEHDVLLANLKPATLPSASSLCSASRHRLTGWRLRDVQLGVGITIQAVAVDWGSPDDLTERVIRIELGGAQRWPLPVGTCGSLARDAFQTLPAAFAIAAGSVATGNVIWFSNTNFRTPVSGGSGTLAKPWVDLKFQMSDGSVRVARFVNTMADRDARFTVTAVGRAGQGPFPFVMCRRLQADYEICGAVSTPSQCDGNTDERERTGNLTAYRELASTCP